jgi:hypothetical protein
VTHGLVPPDDKLDEDVIELMVDLVGLPVSGQRSRPRVGGDAGDAIRGTLWPF